jgi:uncharacterized metal-binding protein
MDNGAAPDKVLVIPCSGIGKVHGLLSCEATCLVTDELAPEHTGTLCLALFPAGNEGERNVARSHPTITIDGCQEQCARWGTERHSGPVSAALVVSAILGSQTAGCSRSTRTAGPPDTAAVWAVAEGGARCSCSRPAAAGVARMAGVPVSIPGPELIFAQCLRRGIAADETGGGAVLEAVRVYHRILPEEESRHREALLAAYRTFRSTGQAVE